MNGKMATKFRRLAEEHTVGMPDVEYVDYRKMRRLRPICTRSVYQRIKDPNRQHRDNMVGVRHEHR